MKRVHSYSRRVLVPVLCVLAGWGAVWPCATGVKAGDAPPAAGRETLIKGAVDFDKEIRPIFAASCVECHGAEKHKGGLRLDSKSAAMSGGASGPWFVSGKGV